MIPEERVDDAATGLRAAMRRMPSAVAIVATTDPADGRAAGLAASAVIPVSMQPPSMLVAVNRQSSAHAAIERAGRFSVNILGTAHTDEVAVFGQGVRRDERFASGLWEHADGLPYLPTARASIFCAVRTTLVYGTHELFVGEVDRVILGEDSEPLGWLEGSFAEVRRI